MIVALLAVTTLVVSTAHSDDVSELARGGQLAVDELHAQWSAAPPAERAQLAEDARPASARRRTATPRASSGTPISTRPKGRRAQSGRPILSLHLLGRLDEELSCANSRFFRTLLYSDDRDRRPILRDQYVLHWHSVRDVPRITIDIGDGRNIRQTITGNSAHYLLDADGNALDVLPGLYSPAAFREQLQRWLTLYQALAGTAGERRADILARYRRDASKDVTGEWTRLRVAAGIPKLPPVRRVPSPTAQEAAVRANSKMYVEAPVLARLDLGGSLRTLRPDEWAKLGALEAGKVELSPAAIALINRKQPATRSCSTTCAGPSPSTPSTTRPSSTARSTTGLPAAKSAP